MAGQGLGGHDGALAGRYGEGLSLTRGLAVAWMGPVGVSMVRVGRVKGCCSCDSRGSVGWVGGLAPDARRRGREAGVGAAVRRWCAGEGGRPHPRYRGGAWTASEGDYSLGGLRRWRLPRSVRLGRWSQGRSAERRPWNRMTFPLSAWALTFSVAPGSGALVIAVSVRCDGGLLAHGRSSAVVWGRCSAGA